MSSVIFGGQCSEYWEGGGKGEANFSPDIN